MEGDYMTEPPMFGKPERLYADARKAESPPQGDAKPAAAKVVKPEVDPILEVGAVGKQWRGTISTGLELVLRRCLLVDS